MHYNELKLSIGISILPQGPFHLPSQIPVHVPPNSFFFQPAVGPYPDLFALATLPTASGTINPLIDPLDITFTYRQLTNPNSGVTYPASDWGIHSITWEGAPYSLPSQADSLTWDQKGITALSIDFGPTMPAPPTGTYQNAFLTPASIVFHTINAGPPPQGTTDIYLIAGQWLPVQYVMFPTNWPHIPPGNTYGV